MTRAWELWKASRPWFWSFVGLSSMTLVWFGAMDRLEAAYWIATAAFFMHGFPFPESDKEAR